MRLLEQWQKQQPTDETLARKRIQLAIASGEFGRALNLSNDWLARHPGDEWAKAQRRTAIERLAALVKSVENSPTIKQ